MSDALRFVYVCPDHRITDGWEPCCREARTVAVPFASSRKVIAYFTDGSTATLDIPDDIPLPLLAAPREGTET